jgi:hypothetical protein
LRVIAFILGPSANADERGASKIRTTSKSHPVLKFENIFLVMINPPFECMVGDSTIGRLTEALTIHWPIIASEQRNFGKTGSA